MTELADEAYERASALYSAARPADALPYVQRALAAEPDDAESLALLSRILLDLDRNEDARTAALAARRSEPEWAEPLALLAACEARSRRFDVARSHLTTALGLAPHVAGLHLQLAYLDLADDRPTSALRHAEEAKRLTPNDGEPFVVLASALLALGRLESAMTASDEALRLAPDDPDAHHIKGEILLHQGGGAESVSRFREALRINPNDPAARAGLQLALKTRNPLFKAFFSFEMWMDGLPNAGQWAVRLSPFIISRAISPIRDTPAGIVVFILLGLFVALSWTTEPIANLVLLANRRDRRVVPHTARVSAGLFAGFLLGVVAAAVVGLAVDERVLLLTLGLSVWAAALGNTHLVRRRLRLIVVAGGLAQPVVAAGLLWAQFSGNHGARTGLWVVMFFGGLAALIATAVAPAPGPDDGARRAA